MIRIKEISLRQMRNGSHYVFMSQLLQKAEADTAVSSKAATYISALRKALAFEDDMLKVSTKSKLTDLISRADNSRGALYRSFKNVLPGFLTVKSPTVVEAATDLLQLIKDYRIRTTAPMLVETGMLSNFVRDLETKYKTQLETLGLTVIVQLLGDANNEVNELMVERTESRQNAVVKALPAARKATDEAYHDLVGMVNGLVYTDSEEPYADFIAFVNAQIVYFRREALRQKSSLPKSDGSRPGSGTDNPGDETPDNPENPGGGSEGPDDTGGEQGGNSGGGADFD